MSFRVQIAFLLSCFSLLACAAEPDPRFVQKLALPAGQTAVVAEGDFEARSIGSYSVRIYSTEGAQPGDDTTFFSSGTIRSRDGSVEKIFLANLEHNGQPCLIVTIRSAGSGGYLSVDAFSFEKGQVALRDSVSGLPPDADPLSALKASSQSSQDAVTFFQNHGTSPLI